MFSHPRARGRLAEAVGRSDERQLRLAVQSRAHPGPRDERASGLRHEQLGADKWARGQGANATRHFGRSVPVKAVTGPENGRDSGEVIGFGAVRRGDLEVAKFGL